MTLLQPVDNEKRDQSWPAKGHLGGLARLNGDFFNAIDPQRSWSQLDPTAASYWITSPFDDCVTQRLKR
jgi:hypothetical protein